MQTLTDAIAGRRLVEIEYLPVGETTASVRAVEPYRIERELPNWYVHTWDRTRDGERHSASTGCAAPDLLDDAFEPRPGIVPARLSDSRTARVLFSKKIARWRIERGAGRRATG